MLLSVSFRRRRRHTQRERDYREYSNKKIEGGDEKREGHTGKRKRKKKIERMSERQKDTQEKNTKKRREKKGEIEKAETGQKVIAMEMADSAAESDGQRAV